MQRLTLEERHKVGKLDQMHVQQVRKTMVQIPLIDLRGTFKPF